MANIEKRSGPRGTAYRVKVRLKGHPQQIATFERLTDARKWAQDVESNIRHGRHFAQSEAKKHTLAELIDRYIRAELPKKPKSAKDQKRQLEWWKARLGHMTLADTTPALLAETRDKLAAGMLADGSMTRQEPKKDGSGMESVVVEPRSPGTVIRYMAALSHAFTIARKEWGWLERSPLENVSKPAEPRGRTRYLSDDEREALLKACETSDSADLYLAVVLALSTGARRSEIMSLRWKQVDLKRSCITLTETKNGEIRSIPLVSKAHTLMQARAKVRRLDTDLVFPGKDAEKPIDLRGPFETALVRAKISDFRWHDLRHSTASYLAMGGASLAEIAEVLGHKTLAMVKRYAHLSPGHTAKVVERMNERIFG